MFIGRLARLTGCTPKAIRLYEQMGLINTPQRSGRYRLYDAHHVQMVHLIRKAQAAGFKLAQIDEESITSADVGDLNAVLGTGGASESTVTFDPTKMLQN